MFCVFSVSVALLYFNSAIKIIISFVFIKLESCHYNAHNIIRNCFQLRIKHLNITFEYNIYFYVGKTKFINVNPIYLAYLSTWHISKICIPSLIFYINNVKCRIAYEFWHKHIPERLATPRVSYDGCCYQKFIATA